MVDIDSIMAEDDYCTAGIQERKKGRQTDFSRTGQNVLNFTEKSYTIVNYLNLNTYNMMYD